MDTQYVVGIDIGGQTTKLGVVDARGTVLAQTVIRTDTYDDVVKYVDELSDALRRIIKEAGAEGNIRGIGVGAPNGNYYTGTIENAVNISWGGNKTIAFAKLLSENMDGLPVALTCAVRNNGRTCNCGKTGCLETYASATGVARTAREWLELSDEPSSLRSLDNISSKDVYEAAKEGDKMALKIFEFTGNMLGRSFADFVAFSAPEAIVLFGGLARAKEYLTKPIEESMNANLLHLWRDKIKIVFSQLKESDAAILGASALAWEL